MPASSAKISTEKFSRFLAELCISADVSTLLGFKWPEGGEAGDLLVNEANFLGAGDHTVQVMPRPPCKRSEMFILMFIFLLILPEIAIYTLGSGELDFA